MATATAGNPSDEQVLEAAKGIISVVQETIANPEASARVSSLVPEGMQEMVGSKGAMMGANLILIQIKLKHPTWELSEKRLKKILKANGIVTGDAGAQAARNKDAAAANNGKANGNGAPAASSASKKKKKKRTHGDPFVPSSKVDAGLPLPSNVETHYFNSVKGKGLVATRDFKEGETIFNEEAFIPSPPAQVFRQVLEGELCDYCFLPITHPDAQKDPKLVNFNRSVECSHKKDGCNVKWCNRLCQQRATVSHHPVLCVGVNPLIRPFFGIVLQVTWGAALLSARALARVLLTHSSKPSPSILHAKTTETNAASVAALSTTVGGGPSPNVKAATAEEIVAHLDAFATVDEIARRSRTPAWSIEQQQFVNALSECHKALSEALNPYSKQRAEIEQQAQQPVNTENAVNVRAAKKIITGYPVRKTFPRQLADQIFNLDYFCRLLGRANINTENHGSLYLVQAQINHSCVPNCAVRHLPGRGNIRPATKINIVATQDIKAGEELFITYIPLVGEDGAPGPNIRRRRQLLWRDFMFGPCDCRRCIEELESMDEEARQEILAETKSGDWKRDPAQEEAIARRLEAMQLAAAQQQNGAAGEGEGETETKENDDKDLTDLGDEIKTALGY